MLSLSFRINLYLGQVQFETDTIFIYFALFLTKNFKTSFNLENNAIAVEKATSSPLIQPSKLKVFSEMLSRSYEPPD